MGLPGWIAAKIPLCPENSGTADVESVTHLTLGELCLCRTWGLQCSPWSRDHPPHLPLPPHPHLSMERQRGLYVGGEGGMGRGSRRRIRTTGRSLGKIRTPFKRHTSILTETRSKGILVQALFLSIHTEFFRTLAYVCCKKEQEMQRAESVCQIVWASPDFTYILYLCPCKSSLGV